jgi:hypothetical protein
MEWTEEIIEREILKLKDELQVDHMPNSTEMKNNKRSGLLAAIGKTGGMYHWSNKLGLKNKKIAKKWTDESTEQEIKKVMKVLQINRFPSAAELKSIGRNDLHCRISKFGTYRSWAKRLGLELKSSDTNKGQEYEIIVGDMLTAKGYNVEQMTTKHPYDLLINENVKIDVKVSAPHYHYGSRAHTFRPSKEHPTCDLYICLALDEQERIESVFVIPSKFAKLVTINVGTDSKYNKFINRWDYLETYSKFYDELVLEKVL